MLYNPSETCRLDDCFRKSFSLSLSLMTHGIFIGKGESGNFVLQSEDLALPIACGKLFFFGGEANLAPIDGECTVMLCEIGGDAAAKMTEGEAHSISLLTHPRTDELFRMLCEAAAKQKSPHSAEAFALLCSLCDAAMESEARLPALVARAIAHIQENYCEIYGVQELSDELDVSKSHLIRAFSTATGKSPGQYLTEVRIGAAKRLLLNPDYNLEIIAGLCGFSSANYLCRVFRRHTGISPAQYRRIASDSDYTPLPQEQLLYV